MRRGYVARFACAGTIQPVADEQTAREGAPTTEWPYEGHFVVGGSGLYMTTDCVGRTFTSRIAGRELTIGFPQINRRPDPIPPEVREQLGEPPMKTFVELIPPDWTFGPANKSERADEERISPVWGAVLDDGRAKIVYPESSRDSAVVYRCRFYATLSASADATDFDSASTEFLAELDDWWTRFTSWVGILTGQDFVGLGGNPGGITQAHPLFTWTGTQDGQRRNVRWRYIPPPNHGVPQRKLQLADIQKCVAAAGDQSPPAEWLFIRDARSLLGAGQARRAILDAGTAAELAMTALIDQYLDDTAVTDEAVRAAFGRFNNLVAKQEVLKLLRRGLLPERTRPDLIDVRNTAIHGRGAAGRGWDEVTLEQAEKALEIATEIVEAAHPLTSLLPSSP